MQCDLNGARPDLYRCQAVAANGVSTALNAGRQRDGSIRIYGIVVTPSSTYQSPKWLPFTGGGIIVLGLALFVFALIRIFSMRAASVVATLPLVAEQRVQFPAPGDYILNADAPRFSTAFGGLSYSLVDIAAGREISSFPALLRAHSAGMVRVRMALRRFFVERAGEHLLRISGLDGRDRGDARVVFSKAWPPIAFLWVVLAIGGGLLMMLGLFVVIAA